MTADTPNPDQKKLTALVHERKRFVEKTRRLNYKLAQVEKLVGKLEELAVKDEQVPSKTVLLFVKACRKEIGRATNPTKNVN